MTSAAATQGIFDLLIGSASLAALVSDFEGDPAVFFQQEPPGDAQPPYVHSRGFSGFGTPLDLDGKFREIQFSVEAYTDETGDPTQVNTLGDTVADLFRVPTQLAIAGYRIVHTVVEGPIEIDTDPDTYGRSVAVRCMIYPE